MFDYIVSLGWYCGVAASISRNGFRECSGPFDWMFSDFDAVLHFLETRFKDYLDRSHLKEIDKLTFEDDRGIKYTHDIKTNLDDDYANIKDKYDRRVQKFLSFTNILFIRAVRNKEEISYIKCHEEYIRKTIGANEIVFLIPKYMDFDGELNFRWFPLNIYVYQGEGRASLRDMFDFSEGFVEWLIQNYSSEKRNRNLVFDLEKEYTIARHGRNATAVEVYMYKAVDRAYQTVYEHDHSNEERCQNLARMIRTDFNKVTFPPSVDIYGLELVGESLYSLIQGLTQVKCFIDKDGGKAEVPIIKIDEYKWSGRPIIITQTYHIDEIKKDLLSKGVPENAMHSLKEYLN